MKKDHVIIYLLVLAMFCCGKKKKRSVSRDTLAVKEEVIIKSPNDLAVDRLVTIKDYWPMFQKAVEQKDREAILTLIRVRRSENDSMAIGIPKDEVEGLINVILHEDISAIIIRTRYGLERVSWDIGVKLPSEKPIYYLNAKGHFKETKEGMPNDFAIQLFFGEVEGEYRLFHQLYAG